MAKKTLTGTTSSGYKYNIPMNRLTSYEFVEALQEHEENPLAFVKVVNLLLGDDKKDFLEHLRGDDGTVQAERVSEEVLEIFNSQKSVKN